MIRWSNKTDTKTGQNTWWVHIFCSSHSIVSLTWKPLSRVVEILAHYGYFRSPGVPIFQALQLTDHKVDTSFEVVRSTFGSETLIIFRFWLSFRSVSIVRSTNWKPDIAKGWPSPAWITVEHSYHTVLIISASKISLVILYTGIRGFLVWLDSAVEFLKITIVVMFANCSCIARRQENLANR